MTNLRIEYKSGYKECIQVQDVVFRSDHLVVTWSDGTMYGLYSELISYDAINELEVIYE